MHCTHSLKRSQNRNMEKKNWNAPISLPSSLQQKKHPSHWTFSNAVVLPKHCRSTKTVSQHLKVMQRQREFTKFADFLRFSEYQNSPPTVSPNVICCETLKFSLCYCMFSLTIWAWISAGAKSKRQRLSRWRWVRSAFFFSFLFCPDDNV